MFADEAKRSDENESRPEDDFESFLVEQARAGEAVVWEHWFDEYYERLYRYAFFRTRRKADAEDIVSQVFLEAVKGIDRYRYQGRPIIAWLFRIAHNLIADNQKRQQRRSDNEGASLGPSSRGEGPESAIENLDLLQALDGLGDDQRDVILLRFFMSMRAREIAEILGKSEAAVYSLQARALLTLRQTLGDVPPL